MNKDKLRKCVSILMLKENLRDVKKKLDNTKLDYLQLKKSELISISSPEKEIGCSNSSDKYNSHLLKLKSFEIKIEKLTLLLSEYTKEFNIEQIELEELIKCSRGREEKELSFFKYQYIDENSYSLQEISNLIFISPDYLRKLAISVRNQINSEYIKLLNEKNIK